MATDMDAVNELKDYALKAMKEVYPDHADDFERLAPLAVTLTSKEDTEKLTGKTYEVVEGYSWALEHSFRVLADDLTDIPHSDSVWLAVLLSTMQHAGRLLQEFRQEKALKKLFGID